MHTPPRILMLLVGGIACLQAAATALAAEDAPKQCPICHHANNASAPYAEHTSSTLVRGALNTAFGWTDLLIAPAAEVQTKGNLVTGLGKGISHALKRTAQGVGELVTFWVPRTPTSGPPLATDCPICRAALASPSTMPPPKKSLTTPPPAHKLTTQ